LVTNATDSGAQMVRAALERVDLANFFTAIYTSTELVYTKTDPAFFYTVTAELGISPTDAVMVGDNYKVDVLGAQAAGVSAVWYNPNLAAAPVSRLTMPQQDGDLARLEDLPGLLAAPSFLPSVSDCFAWQKEQGMPLNIKGHSAVVANVAYLLAVWLRQRGLILDPLLAHRGGLLHDLDKMATLNPLPADPVESKSPQHGKLAWSILMARGQPALAEIARRHNLPAILNPPGLQTWEQKLVFYADKLVEGEQLVSLADWLNALKARYPDAADEINLCKIPVIEVESEFCALLGQTAATLLTQLSKIINQ
jgi:putative hydrolase of the HAD superfamily